MNRAIFAIMGGGICVVIGGGISYLYLKNKYNKVIDSEVEAYRDEISELRDTCSRLQGKTAKKLNEAKEKIFNDEVPVVVDNPDDIIDESDEDIFDVEPTKGVTDIRFISKKDYEDDDDFEKEEISYYMLDGAIIQDDEELEVLDFEQVCGPNALPLLRKDKSLSKVSGSGDNELYIRNEEYATDYKIIRHHKAYNA